MVGTRFYGRMGNVFFQAAHCIAFALRNNEDFSMPNRTTNPFWNPLYLGHLVHPNYIQGREDVLINENGHQWQPIEYKEEWRGKQVVLNGYWQSEKYFLEYRDEILYLFQFPKEQYETISLHARFGDYLTVQMNGKKKHVIVDERYILEAIELVKNKTGISNVKVFSDDIPLFKEKFAHLYNFEYSTNKSEEADMREMSCCHSFINSSSTFSWWSAWLSRNPDKVIVTQKHWFHPDGWMGLDTSDIVPNSWIKL